MQDTIKSPEAVGLTLGYIESLIDRINIARAFQTNRKDAVTASAYLIKELETLLREAEEAAACQESSYPLKDGWYERSKPTQHPPYKLPETEPNSIERLFIEVMVAADLLFIRYFETQHDPGAQDLAIRLGSPDDPQSQHYTEFLTRERLRWARRLRVVFNKVEDFCKALFFEEETKEKYTPEWFEKCRKDFGIELEDILDED